MARAVTPAPRGSTPTGHDDHDHLHEGEHPHAHHKDLPEATGARPERKAVATALITLGVLVGLGLLLRLFQPERVPGVQNFTIVFSSLLIEAIPFILMGAVVSAGIEVLVPSRVFDRLALLPGPLQLPVSGLAGFAFPVCECGSIPVARRLAHKGLSTSAAVTFMLAAPIVNPVVLISTAIAYRGREVMWIMVFGRAALGFVTAIAVGWIIGNRSRSDFLKPRAGDHGHDHSHDHESRVGAFFDHLAGDFTFMGRYLVIGAAVAATMQTFVPQSIISSVAGLAVIDIVALMVLAFLLSLCSESDAFVAASFVQFGAGAQLAFLVFGPMLDTKLSFLYSATFSRGFLRTVVIVAGSVILAGTLWIEVIVG